MTVFSNLARYAHYLCLSQKLEQEIKNLRQQLSISALSKAGYDDEMNELIRSRTELECTIADLQQAGERGEERKEELEADFESILRQITDKESELMEVTPEWQDRVKEEKEEKRR